MPKQPSREGLANVIAFINTLPDLEDLYQQAAKEPPAAGHVTADGEAPPEHVMAPVHPTVQGTYETEIKESIVSFIRTYMLNTSTQGATQAAIAKAISHSGTPGRVSLWLKELKAEKRIYFREDSARWCAYPLDEVAGDAAP